MHVHGLLMLPPQGPPRPETQGPLPLLDPELPLPELELLLLPPPELELLLPPELDPAPELEPDPDPELDPPSLLASPPDVSTEEPPQAARSTRRIATARGRRGRVWKAMPRECPLPG
jgi:hypothetical protein